MPLAVLIIYYIIFGIATFQLLYNAILYFVGFLPIKTKYPMVDDKLKFVVLVPCHNEGSVIAATVENYSHMTYNKDLYDIYFIADNCTDNTAEEVKKAIELYGCSNFHCLERNVNDPNKKGKPHALRWAMELLEAEDRFYNYYDMFFCLDADNFVDPDILKHVNSQYIARKPGHKPVMIQTYLDCKNNQLLIARGYFTNYRVSNRCAYHSRSVLHLNTVIGGTGFALKLDFLKSIGGYNCTSLTEDLEIQTIAALKGETILYNSNARIYDEKPTGFFQGIRQVTRWAQGHWYLYFKYTWRLFLSLFNPKKFTYILKRFDMMIYLSGMFFVVISAILGIFSLTLNILQWTNVITEMPYIPQWLSVISTVIGILTLLLVPISTLYDGKKSEKKRVVIDFFVNNIALLSFTLILSISAIRGLFMCGNQKVWKKTVHKQVKNTAK